MPDQPDSPTNGTGSAPTPRGVSPIMPGRAGRLSYSLDALRELIERQFNDETAGRADILIDLDTDAKRRELLTEIADYVLTTAAITLTSADRRRLLDSAYANLFSFGPLDDLLRDETVTEITINGPFDIHVRHGMASLQKAPAAFDDVYHLETIMQRMLASAGLTLGATFLETGLTLYGRPTRLSIIAPPVRTGYSIEMRLHPSRPVTLDDLRDRFGTLDATAITLLNAMLRGKHGILIVGDAGTGKTTLANALITALGALDAPPTIAAAARAAEYHLPDTAAPFTPEPEQPFAEPLRAALAHGANWLLADEIRSDDAAALWDALTRPHAPHYLWVLRGARQPDRLKSALSMILRQHHPALPQADINAALVDRLPFVIALRRTPTTNAPRLATIAEWTRDKAAPAALSLRPLLNDHGAGWTLTGARPAHALDLPDAFWDGAS